MNPCISASMSENTNTLPALCLRPCWSTMSGLKAVQSWLSSNRVKASAHLLSVCVPMCLLNKLLEHTGHYHRALVQYLQELDVSVYIMPVQKRPAGLIKTDKRDALGLANHLYNQLELGVQLADKTHLVRRLLPASEAALQLKGGIRHRYELMHESTQRKNKLTAISYELFPEFTWVLKDPNGMAALALREHFPPP